MSALRIVRLATWALVIALTVATAVVLWRGDAVPPSTEEVAIGGPFTLVDTDGQTFTEKSLAGRPHAIFFGFTHCPEVCPTTLSEISVLVDDLGPDGEKLDVYFVTVDPERDDPETIKSYLSSFSGKIEGLTGTEDEVATITTAYKVFRRKVPTDDGDYTMDHTAGVYLFGADGRFRGTIAYGENHDDALAKLKRLVS
jgi:protein SCO1/2